MAEERIIPLHQNESYWLLDHELARAYATTDPLSYATYPSYTKLREAVASYAGVDTAHVFLSAGSDAAIRALAARYRLEGRRVIMPVPTFYGYERIFSIESLPFTAIMYGERDGAFVFPLEDVLGEILDGDVVFLCNPNNPLGCAIPDESLSAVLDACAGRATAVVDEAYFEFTGATAVARLQDQDLVILRTLSKAFGLAGARVGYALASPDIVTSLEVAQLPWSIAHPSVVAAEAALNARDTILPRLDELRAAREHLRASLADIPGVTPYPSETNFILFRVAEADRIRATLSEEGILVASAAAMTSVSEAKALLKDCLRMAVPSPADHERVIRALRRSMA